MFKILKLGELEPMSIGAFKKIISKVDFFPIYQRYGNIWGIEKKKLLIDTIINGFDIPKFYFNYFIEKDNLLNSNNAIYAVIDGKQRLQIILDFLDDKFGLDKEFVFYENPDYNLKNLYFSELSVSHSSIASIIENYILDIVYIVTDEEDKLEDLFLRLNGGYALTNAERRNAIGGFLNKNIREIVEDHVFFTNKLKFKNPRYQYQDLLTKLLFVEYKNELVSLTNSSLEKFVREMAIESDDKIELLNRTRYKLNFLSEIFQDNDNLLKGKGIIPVYYYFIFRQNFGPVLFRMFFEQFEILRIQNRSLSDDQQKSILIDFDRLNQQGVHRDKSLKERYEVLRRYFEEFLITGVINLETSINTNDLDILDEDDL